MSLEWLAQLKARGAIRAVDYHFAVLLARRAHGDPAPLALAAALASFELGRGNVCADLDTLAGAPWYGLDRDQAPLLDSGALRAALAAEPELCAMGSAARVTPLVLDGGRLYLHRYWIAERRVGLHLHALAMQQHDLSVETRRRLDDFFDDTTAGAQGQKTACLRALTHGLGIITGGPGTGKTTTAARLLSLLATATLQRGARFTLRIAAPTGKAAARVNAALSRELATLRQRGLLDAGIEAQLLAPATTVHRLLGAHRSRGFAYGAGNPLPADVVMIDESSMLDLRLIDALLQALPAQARLILLGDKDQLAAVEAGNVFGALCAAAVTGATGQSAGFADVVGVLDHSYRFAAHSGIGRLAAAVNRGDSEALQQLLASPPAGITVNCYGQGLARAHIANLAARFAGLIGAVQRGADATELLAQLDAFRVLSPLREGPFGVAGLNQAIEAALARSGVIETDSAHYAGRPILVTRNDHGLRLYNGDLGLLARHPDGELRALFSQPGVAQRWLPIARLPEHETAFAMTVHKSQGSEFDEILLVLPPAGGAAENGLLCRELIYTAITRARIGVSLLMSEPSFDPRWLQPTQHRSGLAGRIGDPCDSE